jgi:hypothetical protein
LIDLHNSESTHYDGPKCPFYPSCAAFGKKAIKTHPILAIFLIIDRLFFRESGNYEDKYMIAPSTLSESIRFYDPVSDNVPNFSNIPKSSLYKESFR